MKKSISYILVFLIVFSCDKKSSDTTETLDSILSASVAFKNNSNSLQDFFNNPSKAYISGYFYFEDDLATDIIFGLDIELFEGVDNPRNFPGADWMAFVGVTREGTVWIPVGLPENDNGIVTTNNWEIRSLNTSLESNTWYKMTIEADFNTRKFISVKVQGDTIDTELDISDLRLQYPNYAPFDKPTLTFYAHAGRSSDLAENNTGNTKVYFDDIEAGIWINSAYEVIVSNGFETQLEISEIPINSSVIPISSIQEDLWYFENENAKCNITSTIARTGNNSILCDADLLIQ